MWRQEARQTAQIRVNEILHAPLADAAQIRDRRRHMIGGQGDRLSVEIAARDDFVGVREHERIIGRRVHLAFHDACHMGEGIAERAVNLRHAADTVGVLHLVAVRMRHHDFTGFEKRSQIRRTGCLAGMRPHLLQPGVKRLL